MAQEPKKRGRTSGMSVLLMLLLVLVGAAGAVGTLLLLGDGTLFGKKSPGVQAREKDEDHEGKVGVPLSVRVIDPYETVTREDLINPQTKDFLVQWVDKEKVAQNGFITDPMQIIGRVTRREKKVKYAFTEADFMPKGTRPGPAAAVEAGMSGIAIDPAQIPGFEFMGINDRFDIVATQKVDSKAASTDPRFSTPEADRAKAEEKAWDTTSRILASDGKVIQPLSLDPAKRKGQKVFVQVKVSEVGPLTEALAVGAKLSASFRGSAPGAGDTDLPTPAAAPKLEQIQVIQGGKTTTISVPATPPTDDAAQPAQEPK